MRSRCLLADRHQGLAFSEASWSPGLNLGPDKGTEESDGEEGGRSFLLPEMEYGNELIHCSSC